jgi:hypothetical protein
MMQLFVVCYIGLCVLCVFVSYPGNSEEASKMKGVEKAIASQPGIFSKT